MSSSKKISIKRYSILNNIEEIEDLEDLVVTENALKIFINNAFYVTLMCTPDKIIELGIGFLFSEGIIKGYEDIKNIEIQNENNLYIDLNYELTPSKQNQRVLTTGCGKGSMHINLLMENQLDIIKSKQTYNGEIILNSMREFNSSSMLFKETGGVHSCCICGENGIEKISEDIGRHNAVDKLIGSYVMEGKDLSNKMLFITGRISSDILIKTARAQIPILVSHSAPTDLAIGMGKNIKMTIVGFARGNRMNIYSGHERILIKSV